MKRITPLLMAFAIVALTAFTSTAQFNYKSMTRFNNGAGATNDTVTNAGVKRLCTGLITNSCSDLVIQVNVTEVSGTTGGTVIVQESLDSVGWDNLYVTGVGADTTFNFVPTDVTTLQPNIWHCVAPAARYYRVQYTGTGTMVARMTATVIGRRKF